MNWGGNWAVEAATMVRYNIVVNNARWSTDANGASESATLILNTNSNSYFYNNVFYNDKARAINIRSGGLDHAAFVNNVFWTNADTVLDLSNWKTNDSDGKNVAYFDHNAYYNHAGVITNGATDYNSKLGKSFADDNAIIPSSDPFGLTEGAAAVPGGAGTNENRAGQGYTGIITSANVGSDNIQNRIKDNASYFKIDSSSVLYREGRPVTKKEVDDFIWGKNQNIPSAAPHASTVQRGDPDTFNKNGGRDFFGNLLPNPETPGSAPPSIGAHNP